ncbi:hypothetical protein NXS19_003184 [Fusarium pseudograminearum]|nr:hypothetical protein NXS19_003184 [Fusarium pseudograminearum]
MGATVPTNDQILVPETLLKKRKSQEKARAERTDAVEKKKAANKEKRQVIFKRAEKYVQEYRDAEREKVRLHRVAKSEDSAYVPAEANLIFVVRIKGINKMPPSPARSSSFSVSSRSTTVSSSRSPRPSLRCSRLSSPGSPTVTPT